MDYQAGLITYASHAFVLLAAAAGVVGAAPLVIRVLQTQGRTGARRPAGAEH